MVSKCLESFVNSDKCSKVTSTPSWTTPTICWPRSSVFNKRLPPSPLLSNPFSLCFLLANLSNLIAESCFPHFFFCISIQEEELFLAGMWVGGENRKQVARLFVWFARRNYAWVLFHWKVIFLFIWIWIVSNLKFKFWRKPDTVLLYCSQYY